MKQKKNTGPDNELNFWQPTSDLMSALLYILMLVIVLLSLYLIYIPAYDQPDPDIGDSFAGAHSTGEVTPSPTPRDTASLFAGLGGGGGDDDNRNTPTPSSSPTVYSTPSPTPDWPGNGSGDGNGPGQTDDPGIKSAVYVMVIDAETERTIKEENVSFELYGLDGALQILNVYYPERVTYRTYMTTESGTFYFPEKLAAGDYELHELTAPEGYDVSGNIAFRLEDQYDWPEPLVVRVPLYPSRNIIRVQMTDAETGMTVSGGSFDVIAAQDIITADGTLRFITGQTAGTILCDENGYGESEPLYLGSYLLRQRDIPQYYASCTEDVEVNVEKRSSVLPAINTIASERTRIRLTVADELFDYQGIEGAVLNIRPSVGQPFTVTTGYTGTAVLEELEKGVTYRITQTVTGAGYQPDRGDYSVTVTASGRIGQDAETTVSMTNRLLRVSIGITDEFSKVQIPGQTLSLFDMSGQLLKTWTTTGSSQLFTDLTPGTYEVVVGEDTEHRYSITVRDQAEVQELNIHTTYVMQYIIFGVMALIVILVLVLLLVYLRRRKKK